MKDQMKNKVLSYLAKKTSESLYSQNYEDIGSSANDISAFFYIDRSNASRILNKLFHEGKLCKKIGRPTIYIHLGSISKIYPNHTCPKIIASGQNIEEFLFNKKSNISFEDNLLFQNKHIGYSLNESMYLPIIRAKKILFYPDKNNILFINGVQSPIKDVFISDIKNYYKSTNFLINNSQYVTCFIEELLPSTYKKALDEVFSDIKNKKLAYLKIAAKTNMDSIENLYIYIEKHCVQLNKKTIFLIDLNLGKPDINTDSFLPIVTIPDYLDLTAKERIEYVFKYIHEEAKCINKTFVFDKNLISCIVMCTLVVSLKNLKGLIRSICINGYSHNIENDREIKLTLDDIPGEVLDYIEGTNEFMDNISNILKLFPYKNFYVFPQIEFAELNTLLNTSIDENQKVNYLNLFNNNNLINECKRDIEIIQSLYVEDTYNSNEKYNRLFFILKNSNLMEEKYVKILTYHLYKAIEYINNGDYQDKSILNEKEKYTNLTKDALELIRTIEMNFSIDLPFYEKAYINTFLIYINENSREGKISVIFCMSSSKISDVYSLTVNQTYNENFTKSSSISFSKFYDDYETNFNIFVNELAAIDHNKGIIILTDTYLPFNLIHGLISHLKSEVKIVNNLTILQIKKIYDLYKANNANIEELDQVDSSISESDTNVDELAKSKNLFEVLKKNLQDQLLFLDAYKLVPILETVFKSIIHELSIESSNNLLVNFLMHTSFVIERTIKNESFPYKSINKLQRKNSNTYNIVYKNFAPIESLFKFKIKDTEYAYIVEIFADALDGDSIKLQAQNSRFT